MDWEPRGNRLGPQGQCAAHRLPVGSSSSNRLCFLVMKEKNIKRKLFVFAFLTSALHFHELVIILGFKGGTKQKLQTFI